jgi:predicted O-methyltransferase YrrM
VRFSEAAAALVGVPYMGVEQGRIIYDHIRSTVPTDVLEIGTAHGAGAAYIAAALKANGAGCLVTVDSDRAGYADPTPEEVLRRLGLMDVVELVRVPDSSYTWFLRNEIAAQSDTDGNCEPKYDFCFLDGSHNWTIDGLSALLVEKLLRPGGWLLLDDLDWSYKDYEESIGAVPSDKMHALSERERAEPHVRSVFELLVKQHPSFTEFREHEGAWGWARKAPGEPRRLTLDVRRPLRVRAEANARRLAASLGRRA